MWCSGRFGLHINDDFAQTKMKARVTTTHPYDQYQINHYGGDCTFQTLLPLATEASLDHRLYHDPPPKKEVALS